MSCEIEAWLARRVAQQTRGLSKAGAAYVDDTLAARTTPWAPASSTGSSPTPSPGSNPPPRRSREEQAKATWDVELPHPAPTEYAGTSELIARGDTLLLKASTT